MRIAMIGQKGYPPVHGGIEKHVAELAERMAARGARIDIYSRPHYSEFGGATDFDGLSVSKLPSIPTKHLDAMSHTLVSTLHSFTRPYDIVHYHALGPGLLAGLPRLVPRRRTVLTVHGLDWQREKWGAVLKMGERASVVFPNRTIVVSKALRDYYSERYDHRTTYIPNGIVEPAAGNPDRLPALGINRKYILFVGRLVPEKGCHMLCRAYARLPRELRDEFGLVIAGDAGFTDAYVGDLKRDADPGTIFTGFVHGEDLDTLYANAALVVLPSTLEGLSIALLEGMSYGRCCLVSDIPPNLEASAGYAPLFKSGDADDLQARMEALLGSETERDEYAGKAKEHVLRNYSWDSTVDDTLRVYAELTGGTFPI